MDRVKKPRLTRKEACEVFILLSALAEAGLPLREALGSAADLSVRKRPRTYLLRARDSLVRGKTLSVSMGEAGEGIPPLVIGMLSVADRTGEGARLLAHARDYLVSREKLASVTAGALAYPVMVAFTLVLAVVLLRFAALPAFEQFAAQMGGAAGAEIARLSGRLSLATTALGLGISLGALAFAGAAAARKGSDRAAERIDRFLLDLPLLGPWLTLRGTHEFAFAMEVLLAGGTHLSAALKEASAVSTNRAFRGRAETVRSLIATGRPLSESIAAARLFRREFTQWVGLGERTGRQREVFSRIRAYSGDEIERATASFSRLAEPAVTVVLGFVMAAFIIGFIVPLFGIYGNLL